MINELKNTTFNDIELNNEVVFENNNLLYTGRVIEVKQNTFTISCMMCFTKSNGHKSFYEGIFNFMKKSGKKASYRNTYGNAISFSKSLEQQINN
jgi:hypothetical protein